MGARVRVPGSPAALCALCCGEGGAVLLSCLRPRHGLGGGQGRLESCPRGRAALTWRGCTCGVAVQVSKDFKDFVTAIGECKSKQEEDRIIMKEM